jgi:molybdenum cofactor synthesis domain-containing protein
MMRAAVVTISDRCFRGEQEDLSGPTLWQLLDEAGFQVVAGLLVPDEADMISALLKRLTDEERLDLVITTGGTGPAPRDVTPEATQAVLQRETPGLAELLRWDGYRHTPCAALARGVAGIRDHTLIINLPGNPRAVREGMEVLTPLLAPAIRLIRGERLEKGMCAPGVTSPALL